MEFLDKLTQQASEVVSSVAVKTQEVAKTGQLHVQLRNLHGEERDALVEFGREAFNLHQANALAERSGELAGAAAGPVRPRGGIHPSRQRGRGPGRVRAIWRRRRWQLTCREWRSGSTAG